MTAQATPTERADQLQALSLQASGCTACDLHETRTNVVFGYGDPNADLMIVGEGPGQREDEQGLPFVGRSGKLLDQLLEEIGLTREDNCYIGNVVKCRPPGNRDPRQTEIDACADYLRQQLRLVDPKVVVTLGNFSSKLLLKTDTGITKLRGQAYKWWGRFLVPTFHPAAALRGSARVLAEIREDFQLVADVISGTIVYEPDETTSEPSEPRGSATDAAAGFVEEPVDQLGLFQ
ncbi:MAG: uracil-DNA glycosylase [Acidimicrobiia bacterium]|nr:uracil-DNA glycosylase [Acidimicrobiia bacterium]